MRNGPGLWVGIMAPLIMLAPMTARAAAPDARALLQAADKAIGASGVNSVQYSGTGWLGAFGQSYAVDGDWPRFELRMSRRSRTEKRDYGKEDGDRDVFHSITFIGSCGATLSGCGKKRREPTPPSGDSS